jgi:hypothetical protein
VVFVLLPLGMIETRCVCRDPEIVEDQLGVEMDQQQNLGHLPHLQVIFSHSIISIWPALLQYYHSGSAGMDTNMIYYL